MLLATIAQSKLGLGKLDEALAAAEEAVEITDARGLGTCALHAPIALAQVLIATEGATARARIDNVLARALRVAHESGARVFEHQIHRELAVLAQLSDDDISADREQAAQQATEAPVWGPP